MRSNRTNRREFLGTTAAAAATTWVGARLYAAGADATPGPNDTIHLALIGCGARGMNQVMPSFMKLPGVHMVAVCDVNSKNLARGREKAGGDGGAGGRAGQGGGGGGGAGGEAFGTFTYNTNIIENSVTFQDGTVGTGGNGGAPNGNAGQDGSVVESFDQP